MDEVMDMISKLRSELNKYYIENHYLRRLKEQTEKEAKNTNTLISKTDENISELEAALEILKNHKKLLRKIRINNLKKGALGGLVSAIFITLGLLIFSLLSAELTLSVALGYSALLSIIFSPIIATNMAKYGYSKDSEGIRLIVENFSLEDVDFNLNLEKRAKINLERQRDKINERLLKILKEIEANKSLIDRYNKSIQDKESMLVDKVLQSTILCEEALEDKLEYRSAISL